jgi:hypothetical protein
VIRATRWPRPAPRTLGAAAIALIGGLGIAAIDARPGFDDTGVTAGLLVVVAAIAAGFGARRPWLWALLVGLWTPLLEIPRSGATGSLLALAFAAAGAAFGHLVARAATSRLAA